MNLTRENIKDVYGLSPMQEGIFFHTSYDKSSSAYFEQTYFRYRKKLNVPLVEKSLNELVKRYDVLRTVFTRKISNKLLQIVLKDRKIDFYFEDISKIKDKDDYLLRYREKDRKKSFDLTRDMLMRTAIFQLDDAEYEFIWSFHHIIMDGWCAGILLSQYLEIYNSFLENRPYILPPVKPYRLFIEWLEKQDKNSSKKYWQEYLAGYEEKAVVPRLKSFKIDEYDYINERLSVVIDKEKTAQLSCMAGRNNVTLSTISQVVWGIVLSRYNDNTDVVFGIVVSGRPPELEDVESMVGLFINAIPLRIKYEKGIGFKDLLKQIQSKEIHGAPHHYYPLVEIQNETPLKQDLLDHILIFENYPLDSQIKGIDLDISNIDGFEQTNYDFNIIIIPGDQVRILFNYNGNVYDRCFVEIIANHFLAVIDQVLSDEVISVEACEFLSEEEKKRLLTDFNQTSADYPAMKTLHELFVHQEKKTPDNIALVGVGYPGLGTSIGGRDHDPLPVPMHITYKELNRESDCLVNLLHSKGVVTDTIVGIMLHPSIEIIVGILGILKAGGAYLPIEPGYPGKRISYILTDSKMRILLTTPKLQARVETEITENPGRPLEMITKFINIEINPASAFSSPASTLTSNWQVGPTNLAYVLYTSGSTGNPKGVMVEHQGVVNYIWWAACKYVKNEMVNFPLFTSISFDLTVTSMFTPLITGNKVIIYSEEEKFYSVKEIVEDSRLGVIKLTPTHLKMIVDEMGTRKGTNIRRFIVGGEELTARLAGDISKNFGEEIEIYNEYGPTEAVVGCMIHKFDPQNDQSRTVPIGTPINNALVYLLDQNHHPVPIGAGGQIYVSGDGVARGYLNNPELTAEKFGHDLLDLQDYRDEKKTNLQEQFPGHHLTNINKKFLRGGPGGAAFSKSAPHGRRRQRIYKTGDLARWFPDGNIEYLGRIDHQVKIRGFRIELGEIESQLLAHPAVKDAVVITREDETGDKFLCAYVVLKEELDLTRLREMLSGKFPDYMVPSFFMRLERIPLSSNGKVARNALPLPEITVKNFQAPRDEIERIMTEIWSGILKVEKGFIGIDTNFFALGGHSLKATLMSARIHEKLKVKLPLAEVFKAPTIRQLSGYIRQLQPTKYVSLQQVEEKEYYPLSSAQKRLYFLQEMEVESTVYNLPQIIELKVEPDKERLDNIIRELIRRHHSLRTSFELIDDQPVQRIRQEVDFALRDYPVESSSFLGVDRILQWFVKPFVLSQAPLLRVSLVRVSDGRAFLTIDMHHIISDGISHQILIQEFIALYRRQSLSPLKLHYEDYSEWQNKENKKEGGEIKKQEFYWLKELEGELPKLNLPADYPRSALRTFEGDRVVTHIEKTAAQHLRQYAHQEGATLFMVLFAIYNIFLSKICSQEDIIVGTDIAGRRHVDMESIMGIFINTLALRNYPAGEKTFKTFLKEVKERLIQAFDNQDYQFEDLVGKLEGERDPSRNPLFDAMFGFEALEETPGHIPELEIPQLDNNQNMFENKTAKFDLLLSGVETKETLFFIFEYSTKLFKKETIEWFISYFKEIITVVLSDSDLKLKDIPVTHQLVSIETNAYRDEMEDFAF